jgi:membrane carboxypeptidase/penicillin-binding protein PbpC
VEVQPVTTPQIAYLAHHILSDAIARWPSLGYPNALEIGRPSGAKIGQVEGSHQVWTVGYTPQRVAVFWLGLPEGAENQYSNAVVDPRMSAGLWHALMQYAHRSTPPSDWTQPAGISRMEVCDPSGQLPTQACPEVVSEVFMNGSEPTAPDSLYRRFQINRETGLLATVFTPPSLVEEKTFLVTPPQARAWAVAQKLPVPPEDYDAIQPVESTAPVRIGSPEMFAYVRGQVQVRGRWAGEDFRSYQVLVGKGLNPETWLQVSADGTSPGADGVLGVWDTQGQEGLYAVRLQVVRQDLTVDTATIQVTVDNTPPLARIPYPINGQSFDRSEQPVVTFQAEASDAIGVTRLVWKLDGKTLGETHQQPFTFPWTAATGEHVLEVRAYDMAGNEGISEQVKFSVK